MTDGAPAPSPPDREYLLQEMDALKRELDETVKAIWDFERYALLATAALWGWSIPNLGKGFNAVVWLPLGLNLLLGLRSLALHRHVMRISGYLLTTERTFGPATGGWEAYFRAHSDRLTILTATVLWVVLLTVSLIVPIVLLRHG